ncbi:HAD-like protein [Lentinus brumalis]|uniref:HAD-like protein n=1 Tax=Lentinus brumalis TaxID=2498619 RepID=A0A371CQA5_9APHY|nr:HAD-like protein [Polyporus brumalis]
MNKVGSFETHFFADAVLFDMDGTLTDSISAVEAAWGKVAEDIGQNPAYVISATHGKRAVDNLAHFKPHIKAYEMDGEVQAFEESILFFADAYNKHGPGSRGNTPRKARSPLSSSEATPTLSPATTSSTPRSSFSSSDEDRNIPHRPSFMTRVSTRLALLSGHDNAMVEEAIDDDADQDWRSTLTQAQFDAWQIEACAVDRAVCILPGVKKLMDSLPEGRYAVATSGAKTYAYGCMTRVGITPPPVTITADDKRLKAGKPAPDPFLLAAKELGFDAHRCVVFEDSPSGIKAGVASGAIVIALCTSHERSKIANCGAHFIVETMESVKVEVENGRLRFVVYR